MKNKALGIDASETGTVEPAAGGPRIVILLVVLLLAAASTPFAPGQKASSIVIHDTTAAGAGGENATANLRNEFKAALEREKPCVETMDDQDLRDAIEDERSRALLEGGDSNDTLAEIGKLLGSGMVVSVKSQPGAGGSSQLSAFAFDARTYRTVDRESGDANSAKQMAENLVRSLGPYLADQCKPHWAGTVNYVSTIDETKTKTDAGAMRAAARNLKRTLTETSTMTDTIKASLLPPKDGESVNATSARVMHRTRFIYTKKSSTAGELYCRLPNRNPFWKGFSEEYTETTTQLGQGTGTMPVFISIDDDGSYTIKVNAAAGPLYGKFETKRTASGCDETPPAPADNAISMPEGRLEATSFEAAGKTNPSNRSTLAGSQTLPDGRTKITWNLRLVKPKGK
ncbi:MAG: hypothetical protein JSS81_13955 [Acidobacteria bacterium]|nr:hypothetical protein [Acidobacteriota bacterium]